MKRDVLKHVFDNMSAPIRQEVRDSMDEEIKKSDYKGVAARAAVVGAAEMFWK